ncbi:hypothetical protein PVK06_024425 [Gossypium arboreum]|uniref:DDE Tnp4 domain-containing protein n=1 Tax=Gossypium arboreum TaxID=29729 RepID=A0ABR0PE28_GOSAR|nr:hypothetical protein PVK06_024425 [Gossypium arboreum]
MVQGTGNFLDALDGTHIKIRVPTVDKPRYQTRKGDIATNMLGVCTPNMQFVYVLPGWEGSVADGRVLQDAISRRHGLKVPHGCYYLVDAGYTNCEGFLAPFRGQRYNLNEWRQGYQQSTPEEFFNMKHASTRNVIKRCFGLLKLRWGILKSPSFYPVRVHSRIIIACCFLHNFIRTYMSLDPIEVKLGEGLPSNIVMSGFSQSSVSSQNSQRTKRKWVPEEDATLVACMVNLHNVGTFNADTGFKAGNLNELEKNSHKEAAQFRYRSFPYYDQLTAIYVKDRTTGKDAQTAADIIEEIDVEDIADTNTHEERNDFHGCEADVSLDDMDLSATQPQPARNQEITIQESALKLYPTLCEVEGLTENEHYRALSKILDHPTQMLIFFSTSADH